ncbi:MAG: autotransporter domain-containing protein [Chitinispirillales bacterium]|jgi:hypothetical protein|nr:autotransporter domain-containing protein [Chitinispirillales bacterium]
MKKVLAGVVMGLALGAVSAVSAVDLSVGGGGFFASDFGGGLLGVSAKSASADIEMKQSVPWYGGGIQVFFDAAYAEIGLGLTFAGGTLSTERTRAGETVKDDTSTTASGTGLNISVLGKYPIALSDAVTLFPTAGIDYATCLSASYTSGGKTHDFDGKTDDGNPSEGEPKAGDFSSLWIKFGVGLDYNLSDKLFLRPTVLYGIRLANKSENDMVDDMKVGAPSDAEINSVLGHGLTVKVGIGFKL